MIGKLILTFLVVLGAYAVLRRRVQPRHDGGDVSAGLARALSRGTMRVAASIVLAVMAAGSAIALLSTWLEGQEIVQVQVVNANTGEITTYRAHRDGVQGRELQTLDGRVVRLAEVERMIVLPMDDAQR